jgi:hypothetical protein
MLSAQISRYVDCWVDRLPRVVRTARAGTRQGHRAEQRIAACLRRPTSVGLFSATHPCLKFVQSSRELLLGVKPVRIRARPPNIVSKNFARIVRVSFYQRLNAERPCDSHCLALLHDLSLLLDCNPPGLQPSPPVADLLLRTIRDQYSVKHHGSPRGSASPRAAPLRTGADTKVREFCAFSGVPVRKKLGRAGRFGRPSRNRFPVFGLLAPNRPDLLCGSFAGVSAARSCIVGHSTQRAPQLTD